MKWERDWQRRVLLMRGGGWSGSPGAEWVEGWGPVKEENGRIIRLEVILLVLRRTCLETHMMRLLLLYSYKASLGLGSMTADYLIFSCNYRTTGLLELEWTWGEWTREKRLLRIRRRTEQEEKRGWRTNEKVKHLVQNALLWGRDEAMFSSISKAFLKRMRMI